MSADDRTPEHDALVESTVDAFTAAGFTTTHGGWSLLEALCSRCGETFNPADEHDLEHGERADGIACGGLGEIVGEWRAGPEHDVCRWYALCENPAVGTVEHPVLGAVPVCDRCAARHGLAVTR